MSLKKQRNNVMNPVPVVLPAGHTCGIREYIVSIGIVRYQTSRGEWESWINTPGRGCHQGYLRRVTGQRLLRLLNQAVRDYREKQGGEHHDA
ncbi:hypothetical protein HBZ99_004880 [Salmonella enterica subsp. enterica]|uniref:Uncharacterized protein n=1 Tax=Salmonella enterica subsp. enterica serovar Java TaxID=224729 RepID=A0A5X0ZGS3_SALEB|nr:hypothetical protein [Salmonella enterica subsp. enterica serovar Java]EEP4266324.1 hypothetical protein [Salmonella enterica subsp. enterica serovar Oranienburg]EGO9988939.1 hypothetical protein [Salmonella enterica]EEP8814434.1 hypothetical protein [Salmonella enterica subsp. enterica serovar Oranienburg]EJK8886022.1 hypothetical protein [Salmonella enterica]